MSKAVVGVFESRTRENRTLEWVYESPNETADDRVAATDWESRGETDRREEDDRGREGKVGRGIWGIRKQIWAVRDGRPGMLKSEGCG
ncbi:hypothetical protein Droror1_Dr00018665, partial [Drosera rotundifolia]